MFSGDVTTEASTDEEFSGTTTEIPYDEEYSGMFATILFERTTTTPNPIEITTGQKICFLNRIISVKSTHYIQFINGTIVQFINGT